MAIFNSILIGAIVVVTFALLFYTIAVFTEQKKHLMTARFLLFLTMGISCDITSTLLMIIGSNNIPFTIHGILGYTALAVMLIDTTMFWRFWRGTKGREAIPQYLNVYTICAYCWWVIAYIAGAIISMVIS